MRILVIGALGTIGSKLVPALLEAGHELAISSRDPKKPSPWPEHCCQRYTLDLLVPDTLPAALAGVELVYYLMHGMSDGQSHTEAEISAATHLAQAAELAGVKRIIYMGSLVSPQPKSAHMLARIATGQALARGAVPVTELRAGIIIAPGSAAFEVMRDLVGHMPLALVPKAIATQAPPIALDNIIYYLVKLAELPQSAGQIYEAAGPQWLSYRQLMLCIAKQLKRKIKIMVLPGLPVRLACTVLGVITSVPQALAKALIDGLAEPLQARPEPLRQLLPQTLLTVEQAITEVLKQEQVETYPKRWRDGVPRFRNFSPLHGFYAKCAKKSLPVNASAEAIWQVVNMLGDGGVISI